MRYKQVDQLRRIAEVQPIGPALTRRERLERWAELLGRDSSRRLHSLGEIESKSPNERLAMRSDGSPLTVAFADPVLRADGLASDRLGDAMSFFDLSEDQAHRLLCSCMNGSTMSANATAGRIRGMANPDLRLRSAAWAAAVAALAGAPALVYLFG
jgi:hypothetical protein